MKSRAVLSVAVVGALTATTSIAQDTVQNASFVFNGQEMSITQDAQVAASTVAALFHVKSDCGDICLAPNVAADGVQTITELDVIDFMTNQIAEGRGLLIDGRLPADRSVAYLPTSVNIPHPLVTRENPLLNDILIAMGARSFDGLLNFSDAMTLVVFDDGPTTTDAHNLINALIATGYPASKIQYYRGGMQVWTAVGLSTEGNQS